MDPRYSPLPALAVVVIVLLAACSDELTAMSQPYSADEKSLAKHYNAPDWFRDAKLGIYFHWGPYSVAAKGNEWYPRWMHFDIREEEWQDRNRGYHRDLLPWHTETFGHPLEFGYHDLIPLFTAEHFDADAWADLFYESGARFAGPVAMHHDGYALWDSDVTPWNAADMGPQRDITGELAAAVRERGMKLITTFHHARNLQRYRGQSPEEAIERFFEWDTYTMFWNSHYPWIEGLAMTSDDPALSLLYGNRPEDEWLDEFWLGTLMEVVDKYEPDMIWFDAWLDLIPEEKRLEFAAYYFNAADAWGKDVMITHKDRDMPYTFSIQDFEQGRRDKLTNEPWLTDATITTGSWSWVEGVQLKSASRVVHEFIDIVSKNGQLLLNISPKSDGSIPEDQRAVLKALGGWLKTNGEAIYESRPWKTYGEGPTQMKSDGHFTEYVEYNAQDIRFTAKGDAIYAISLGTPRNEISIVALASNSSFGEPDITSVTSLNGDWIESWVQEHDGLKIRLKGDAPEQLAYAFKVL